VTASRTRDGEPEYGNHPGLSLSCPRFEPDACRIKPIVLPLETTGLVPSSNLGICPLNEFCCSTLSQIKTSWISNGHVYPVIGPSFMSGNYSAGLEIVFFLGKMLPLNYNLSKLNPVYIFIMVRRDSAVGITTGCGLADRGDGVRIFYFPRRPDRSWGPPNFLSNGYRGFFTRG
jgi:hypothetical protein